MFQMRVKLAAVISLTAFEVSACALEATDQARCDANHSVQRVR